jgi:hypothetical protein
VKLAPNILGTYEYAFRPPELVRQSIKYDNRAAVAVSLQFWAAAQNTRDKVSTAEVEVPTNDALELLAEGYAAAFER